MAVLTFVVGYVETKRTKTQKDEARKTEEFRKTTEQRASIRQQESFLNMRMTFTTSELSDVIAHALAGGKVNGNVTLARQNAQKAREDYELFMQSEACKQTTRV